MQKCERCYKTLDNDKFRVKTDGSMNKWCTSCIVKSNNRQKCLCESGKRMVFGNIGDSRPTCCSVCSEDGMVDIVGKRCGCIENRQPSYGYDKAICCFSCKAHDMTDIKNRRCKCNKQPTFGFIDDKIPTCCKVCKSDGMVDIFHKRCKCGKCIATFGFPEDKKPGCCFECAADGMIDIRSRKCIICKIKQPSFGCKDGKRTHCFDCKDINMIDKIHKKCIQCNDIQVTTKYKGYCFRCFIYLFPDEKISRNYKTKENCIVDYLINHGYNGIQDKRVEGGCSRRRPDFFLECYNNIPFIIIVEIDENKHSKYDTTCEISRINDLFTDFGYQPIIFIRFNPDGYKNGRKRYKPIISYSKDKQLPRVNEEELKKRMKVLIETIEEFKEYEFKEDEKIILKNLFYGD
jgi:hypothetical protein